MHKLKSEMVRTRVQREIIKKMCLCLRQTCIECEKDILLTFRHRNVLYSSRSGAAYNKRDGIKEKKGRELIHIYSIRFITLRYELKTNHAESSIMFANSKCKARFHFLYRRASRCHIEKASQDRKERKNDKKRSAIKRTTLGPVMKSSSRPGVKHVNMAIRGEPRAPTSKAKDLRARTSD